MVGGGMEVNNLQKRIAEIKSEIARIGDMRPGSLNEHLTVCGHPNCRCAAPKNPVKHGPYYKLSYVHRRKSTSQFIQKEFVAEMREQLANYKRFRTLTAEWVDLALKVAKIKFAENKDNYRNKLGRPGRDVRFKGTRSREKKT